MARNSGDIDEKRWTDVQRVTLEDAGIDLLCFVASYKLRDGSWGEPKLEIRREWRDSGEPGKREGISLEALVALQPYIVKGGKLYKALVDARKRWIGEAAEESGKRRSKSGSARRKVERDDDDDDSGADASDAKVEALEAKMAQMFELLGKLVPQDKGKRAAAK